MTGRDLDLDAIRQRAQYLHATGRGAYYVAADARDLAAEVERLRAKLAVAEQERDEACESANHANASADRFRHRANRVEAALAAVRTVCAEVNNVREYGERGSTFQAGANQLACRIVRALTAAEQPEPKTMSYYGTGLLARISKQNNRSRV